jgi:hypothetical protein
MWTPGLSLNVGIGFDSAWLGVNALGAALFAWLLALRGHELALAAARIEEASPRTVPPEA